MSKWTEQQKTELIERVFRAICKNEFTDHKLGKYYCSPIDFPRGLGEDIANFVQAKSPKLYHKKKKEVEEQEEQRKSMEFDQAQRQDRLKILGYE